MLTYYQLGPSKFQWNFDQDTAICIQENEFENVVWKMSAIFSQPEYVKSLKPSDKWYMPVKGVS